MGSKTLGYVDFQDAFSGLIYYFQLVGLVGQKYHSQTKKRRRGLQAQEQKNYTALVLFLLPLFIAFGAMYFNSKNNVDASEAGRDIILNSPVYEKVQSQNPKTHVVLPKGYKIFIENTCLVYKGMSNGKINMDFYLLELDRDISYPMNFTKESGRDGIWLGNVLYKLVKVKKHTLRLKIIKVWDSG